MNINDAILASTGGPTLNEGLLAWYRANGATSYDIQDAENEFLTQVTAPPGQLADRWFKYLGGFGYAGSLDDRRYQYWTVRAENLWSPSNINGITNTTITATQAIISALVPSGQNSFQWQGATTIGAKTFRLQFVSNGVTGIFEVLGRPSATSIKPNTNIADQEVFDFTFTVPVGDTFWDFRARGSGLSAGSLDSCTLREV